MNNEREGGFFPICNRCKHYKENLACAAFDLIPDEILLGENDHHEPLPDQKNNIVFTEKDETPAK